MARGKCNNEMVSRGKGKGIACEECTTVCVTVHQKQRDPSAIVTRFFKIMHGQEYSEVLYLPPQFAWTVRDMVGNKTQIENSLGEKWDVKFSYVNNCLAIQEGWPRFFQDHRLEFGDILVFNYIKGSHFIVQIYGTTACEIVDFKNRRTHQNKRLKRNLETVSQDKPFQQNDANLMDNPSSTSPVASGSDFAKEQSFPTPMDIEHLTCVLNRDVGYYQKEERSFLFDLSSFEMKRNTSDAEEALEIDITPAIGLIEEQTERGGDDTQIDYPTGGVVADKFHDKLTDRSNSSKDISNEVPKVQNDDERRDTISAGNPVLPSNIESRSNINRIFEMDNAAMPSSSVLKDQSGTQAAAIKKERVLLGQEASGYPQVSLGNPVLLSNTEPHSIINWTVEEKIAVMPKFRDSLVSSSMLKDPAGKQAATIKKELVGLGQEANGFPQVSRGNPVLPSHTESQSTKFRDSSVSSSMLKDPFGKQAAEIKKELVELGEEANGFCSQVSRGAEKGKAPTLEMKFGNMSAPVVKIEPGFSNDNIRSPSPFDAEVKNQSYLELPKPIPSVPGTRFRGQGKVVYVRDPNGKLWPLFYPDKFFYKAFIGSNWTRFCQANSIVPGDVCKFHVENYKLCYYRVDIIRKKDPHK